jgi:hypothetical protein
MQDYASITVTIDERTETQLRAISDRDGVDVSAVAARMLMRAVRAVRPRPNYDVSALNDAYAPFAEEDAQLAEAGAAGRAETLEAEDR